MNKTKIQELFSKSRILEIPYFQRSYVWDDENLKRFLDDFRDVCSNNKEYFMGTCILKQKLTPTGASCGDVRSVIDGQQRFTTIILFFLVLAIKTNKYKKDFVDTFFNRDEEIMLKHNHTDKPIFEKLISNIELTDEELKLFSSNKVYKAYQYFMDNIEPNDFDVDTLLRNIYFLPIDLEPNDDEQQIFDTINSLGVRLTTAELLKNTLYSSNEVKYFKETWEECFEKDQAEKDFWDTIVGSRDKHSNIDTFLFAYINILDNDDIRYKSLFKSYKDYFDKNKILVDTRKKKAFIKDLISYAKIYRQFINPDIQSTVLKSEKNSIERLNVVFFGLDTTTIMPYCLFVLKNQPSKRKAAKIFGYLETYIVRRMLCHDWTKNYNKKFKTFLTNKILTVDDLIKNIMDGAETEDRMPTDGYLANNIDYDHTNAQAKGILYLLETGLRKPNKESTSVLALSAYDLEHIMPKEWKQYWPLEKDTPENRENRTTHVGFLGNKTLLAKGLNKSIKNREYEVKKTGIDGDLGYNNYAVGLKTFDYAAYEKWDEDAIDSRMKDLIEKIKIVWPYEKARD